MDQPTASENVSCTAALQRANRALDLILRRRRAVVDGFDGDASVIVYLTQPPKGRTDIVNKSHLVAITNSNLCVLRQLSSSL